MQKGKIKFFQIPIIKIELWWIYFRRHTNGCGLVPINGKIAKTFCISRRAMLKLPYFLLENLDSMRVCNLS